MATRTLMTLDQYRQLPDDGYRHEFNRGELIKLPPPKHGHDSIAANLLASLINYVRQQELGRAYMYKGYELDGPTLVRIPDVSFVNNHRLETTPSDRYVQGAPDLAVEVVSPSNDAEDLELKIAQYLEFGASEVWIVYPRNRRVRIYSQRDTHRVLRSGDTLSTPLFPNWTLPVDTLFA